MQIRHPANDALQYSHEAPFHLLVVLHGVAATSQFVPLKFVSVHKSHELPSLQEIHRAEAHPNK